MAKGAVEPNSVDTKPQKSGLPDVNPIRFHDLRDILKLGIQDFLRAPAFGLFFGAIYAIGGLILVSSVAYLDMTWLAYPMVIGFALIGPFIATGLYETSRKLETNAPLTWRSVLATVWEQHRRELPC